MALPTPEVTELPEEVKRARDAAARRASLRATPTATAAPPTAPVASAAPEAAKAGGWFRRAANALRYGATAAGEVATAAPSKMAALPGQILNADLGAAAKGALRVGEGAAKIVGGALTGPMARAAVPIAAIISAARSYGTDTDTYAQRTGIERGASDWTGKGADAGSRLRFDAVKDAGIRALGTAQDLGNMLTVGLADRVGNALAGNGFNRSAGNQVGEVFGRGSEVGDDQPPTAPAPSAAGAAAQPSSADAADMAMRRGAGRDAAPPPTATASGPSTPSDPSTPSGPITYDAKTKTYSDGSDAGAIPGKDGSYRAQGGLIRDQAPTVNADGSITPGTLRGSGQVSTVDTSEGFRQDKMELQRLRGERAEREAGYAGNQPGGGLSGFGGATLSSALRESHDRQSTAMSTDGGNLSPYDAAQLKQQRAQSRQQGEIAQMQNATAQAGQANQLRTAEMNNATLRENNANTARVNLRGHELDFERGMAPIRFQQQQREQIASLLRASGGDPAAASRTALAAGRVDLAETLAKPVGTMQEQAGKADALIETKRKEIATGVKGAFNHMDKDGQPKMSEALEAQAVARIMRSNPNFHQEGDPAKRQKMIDDALGDEELMARFSKPTAGGYGSITPNLLTGNKPMLRQDNIPNDELLARGQIGEPIGWLRNLLSPNTSKGDRFFDPGDGYEAVNMGDLSARALARLEQHRKEAAERLRK